MTTPCPHLIRRIMEVMESAFDPAYGEAWNERQLTDALVMPSTHATVMGGDGQILDSASDQAQPAAFTLTRHAADEEELLLIAVAPQFRRRGLGRKLIRHLFESAARRNVIRIFLEMREGNPAIHLYEPLGFRPIGKRPDYYKMSNGERVNAITFGVTL